MSSRGVPERTGLNQRKPGGSGKGVAKIPGRAAGIATSVFAAGPRGTIAAMTTAELRASVLNLPAAESAALAHELIASLDAEQADPSADALWAAEIERRAQDVAEGKVDLVDADDVHAELSARLRSRSGR